MQPPAYKVAAAHVAPVFLNREATVDKACALIREAALHGAQLIVFPETYIPAFPLWCALQAPIENHALFCQLAAGSLRVDGPEIGKVADAARRSGIFVSLGFNEVSAVSDGCLWNANLLLSDRGDILCHHRKLVPTFYEKLVWAPGDGSGLQVCETRLGRLGMLICGENTNPLARFALLAQGEQVHLSTYPPMWPTRDPATGDNYDLKQAILIRAGAHSFEGKVFNVVASGFLDAAARDPPGPTDPRGRAGSGREPQRHLGGHRSGGNPRQPDAAERGRPPLRRDRSLPVGGPQADPRPGGRVQPVRRLQAQCGPVPPASP